MQRSVISFSQELVQYYQQNSLESSFPEVPTILLIPYKEAVSRLKGEWIVPFYQSQTYLTQPMVHHK